MDQQPIKPPGTERLLLGKTQETSRQIVPQVVQMRMQRVRPAPEIQRVGEVKGFLLAES